MDQFSFCSSRVPHAGAVKYEDDYQATYKTKVCRYWLDAGCVA